MEVFMGLKATFIISSYLSWARTQLLAKPNCKTGRGITSTWLSGVFHWAIGPFPDLPAPLSACGHSDCKLVYLLDKVKQTQKETVLLKQDTAFHGLTYLDVYWCGCPRNFSLLWSLALKWLSLHWTPASTLNNHSRQHLVSPYYVASTRLAG